VQIEGFSHGDRVSLDLPTHQQQLLEHIYAIGKPVVLVLMNGSAVAVNWADEKLPAIIEAWYPGERGGEAIAAALAGDFSPGGRLPVTFYKSADQLPAFEDYSMAKRTYRYFEGDPLYPFGYGLSYTSFVYENPRIDTRSLSADGTVIVSVDIKNNGTMAGDEVVQLYLSHSGLPGAAIRTLKGFQRVYLEQGQKKSVSFTLRDRDLSIVDEEGRRRIVPGLVQVWIGGGQPTSRIGLQRAAGASSEFAIASERVLPD